MESGFIVFVLITSSSFVDAQKNLESLGVPSMGSGMSWMMMSLPNTKYFITKVKMHFYQYSPIRFEKFSVYISNKTSPPGYPCYKHPRIGEYQEIDCDHVGENIAVLNYNSDSTAIYEVENLEILGCPQGWFGTNCASSCSIGCFGQLCFPVNGSCIYGCNCKGDFCDNPSICLGGCKEGWTGMDCTLKENINCKTDTIGTAYKGEMNITNSGEVCQRWDSQDPHAHSYKGETENYCRNVNKDVGGPWCYTMNQIIEWENCNIPLCGCPRKWFGTNCENSCSSKCFGQECFPTNGSCMAGCNCIGDICDATPTCVGGCQEGWTGQYCNESTLTVVEVQCHTFPKFAVVEEFAMIRVFCLGYNTSLDKANYINYSIPNSTGLSGDPLHNLMGDFDLAVSYLINSITVVIKAYIYGCEYFSTSFTVDVKVLRFEEYNTQLDSLILSYHLMNNSDFEEIEPALDNLTATLDLFNAYGNSSEMDVKVREILSLAVVPIKADNITVIDSVLTTLTKVTMKPDRLTEKAQDAVLESLVKISTSMSVSNVTKESEVHEILPILIKIMDVSSILYDKNAEDNTQSLGDGGENPLKEDIDTNAQTNLIKRLLQVIDNVGNSVFNLTDNKTQKFDIETKVLTLTVGRMDDRNRTDIESQRILNGKLLQGSFHLPNISHVLGDSNNTEFGYQMLFSDKNPFQWDESAKNVTTPIVSLKIYDVNRIPLRLTNLTKPVNIKIPTPYNVKYSSFIHTADCDPSRGGDVFRFNVEQLAQMSLMMKIKINAVHYDFLTKLATHMTEKVRLSDVSNGTVTNGTELVLIKEASETAVSWSIGFLPVLLENAICPINITYSIASVAFTCQYWDVLREKWSRDGCKVSLINDSLECQCYHLTDFAGGLFVMPNLVDPIADILLFLTFFENPVIVCTVVMLWFLYFVCLYWSRKADIKDASMTGIIVPFQSNLHDKYKYMVCVVTGWRHRGGTTANVSCFIVGTNGKSSKQCLSVPGRVLFQTGSEDWFLITSSHDLGDINMIMVWHDNRGFSPSWYLSSIMIEDLQTKQKMYFWYENWLGFESGIAKIALHSISFDELKKKSGSQFVMRTMRDLRQNHFLLSIVSRTTNSDFSRAQRLSCAMCLLLCTMLTCLMFHGIPTDDDISKEVSGFEFTLSLKDIIIGIESALIMFPINFMIIALFLKTKPRISKRDLYIKKVNRDVKMDTQKSSKDREKHPSSSSKIFPWWMIFIAWTTVTLTSLVASFFVMLYGLKYGYKESIEWLVSFLTAFVDDVFVMEPLKVAFMAVILTFLLRRPAQSSETPVVITERTNEKVQKEYIGADEQQAKVMQLSKETFEKSKLEHNLNSKVKRKINNLIVNFFFIVIILCVVYNHYSVENGYLQSVGIEHQYAGTNFKKIKSHDEIWSYVKTILMDRFRRTLCYEQEERLVENDFLLLGKFRLRQIRVERDRCVFPPRIKKIFTLSINCSSSLNLFNYDTSNYDKSWNKILSTSSTNPNDEWIYHSAWELEATPLLGQRAIYNGGGYMIELKPEISDITIIDNLSKHNWIDDKTRAIFIEFNLYNPNVNLFSSVVLVIEFDSPGQPITSFQISTSELYNYSKETNLEKLITDALFVLFTLLFTYFQIRKAKQIGFKTYFKGFWNVISVCQMLLCVLIICLYSVRIISTETVLKAFRKEGHNRYLNFSLAILWDNITVCVMAILLAVSAVKFIKLLTLQATLKHLNSVGSYARKPMKNFAVMFIICLLSFVCSGYLLFGALLKDFKNLGDSFMSLISYTVNITNYQQMFETSPFIGPIFLFLYMFMFIFCFMKLFTVIVISSYRLLRKEGIVETDQTLLIFQYISKSIKRLFR